jgi:hypothetical protein
MTTSWAGSAAMPASQSSRSLSGATFAVLGTLQQRPAQLSAPKLAAEIGEAYARVRRILADAQIEGWTVVYHGPEGLLEILSPGSAVVV